MQALRETTQWRDGTTANHTYLIDGDKMVAYIRVGTTEPFWFKQPIKGFSKSGRKFEQVDAGLFNSWRDLLKAHVALAESMPWIKTVAGSKPGVTYTVNTDENTCTCPGFTFRGACKHVKELDTA